MPTSLTRVALFIVLAVMFTGSTYAQEPLDGGVSYGGGQELLESIQVPPIKNAPFSLTLAAEWEHLVKNGGTYSQVNARPIMRDSQGRIYMERRLLEPKGSNRPSPLSWIQITDPGPQTYYQCNPHTHICELYHWLGAGQLPIHPELIQSARSKDGKATRVHEDLGKQLFAGVPVHLYRDTTTYEPGAMGNDLPMSSIREYRFSEELGLNLSSIVDNPQVGRQTFTVIELTTTEPDPKFFLPPDGYTVVDKRNPAAKP